MIKKPLESNEFSNYKLPELIAFICKYQLEGVSRVAQVSKLFKGLSVKPYINSYIVSSVPFYSEIRLYLKGDWRDFRQEEVTLAAGNFNLNVHGNQSSCERW